MTSEELPPFGPREQWIRDYATDIGVLVYAFGLLEKTMLSYIGVFDGGDQDFGNSMLGQIVTEFERRCADPELIIELRGLVKGRNDMIHRTRRFAKRSEDDKVVDDRAGIIEERRRLRGLFEHLWAVERTVRNREGGLLTHLHDTYLNEHGPGHETTQALASALELFGKTYPPPYHYPQPPLPWSGERWGPRQGSQNDA